MSLHINLCPCLCLYHASVSICRLICVSICRLICITHLCLFAGSFANVQEARFIVYLVSSLLNGGLAGSDMGVICLYKAQASRAHSVACSIMQCFVLVLGWCASVWSTVSRLPVCAIQYFEFIMLSSLPRLPPRCRRHISARPSRLCCRVKTVRTACE